MNTCDVRNRTSKSCVVLVLVTERLDKSSTKIVRNLLDGFGGVCLLKSFWQSLKTQITVELPPIFRFPRSGISRSDFVYRRAIPKISAYLEILPPARQIPLRETRYVLVLCVG